MVNAGAMVPQTGMRGAGVLVPVIGPAEAGKGLIIAAAKNAYAGNRAIIFPPRIVAGTPAPGGHAPGGHAPGSHVSGSQEHAVISTHEFDDLRAGGAFAVTWRSGKAHYAIPAALGEEVEAGRVVVVDVSRSVVTALQRRFPRVHVVYITKKPNHPDDREAPDTNEGDLLQTLWNASSRSRPSPVSVIDNSSASAEAVLEFQSVLASYAPPGA